MHALAEAGRVLTCGLAVVPDDALEMRFEFMMATDNVLEQQADRAAQMAVLDELDELAGRIEDSWDFMSRKKPARKRTG